MKIIYKYLNELFSARLLTNHLLVPFLLGLKLNLSSFLPIIFGVLIILAKKSMLLLKIAFIASSVFGQGGYPPGGVYGTNFLGGGYGGGLGGYGYKNYKYQQHNEPYVHSNTGYSGFHDVYDKTDAYDKIESNQESTDVQDKFYDFEKNQLRKTKALSFTPNNPNFYWQTVN